MSGGNPFVPTDAIREAVKGREDTILAALRIEWNDKANHIRCPYPDHPDKNPSWRWDKAKARAYCTCSKGDSIFDVVAKVRGVNFETAKVTVAELLRRTELIRTKRAKSSGGRGISSPNNIATLQHSGCTLAAYATAKWLPIPFLRSLGLSEIRLGGVPAVKIPYCDESGAEAAARFRVALDGRDKFRWRSGDKARLYGLDRLDAARTAGHITIVEGESDSHTLWHAGFHAVGLPGAGNWQEDRDASLLDGIDIIYLVVEPDQGGDTALKWLARSRIRQRVRLLRLDSFKDPSALYLDDPACFAERWRAALAAAVPWQEEADRKAEAEAVRLKESAGDIILDPDIPGRFGRDLERAGLTGEKRNGKVLFLALTSRRFTRPVSVAVKGPSSGGKSFMVETVLKFFPPEAYFERTAMSDRALAYSDEDFQHRHIVIYEAVGMKSDIASYLIRSLLSEGRIKYELVEKTKDGMRPRLIEKPGPTGLIVTTTATMLHAENETRLLSLAVMDTPEQTRAVMHALAASDTEISTAVDYERWHDFQRWLVTGAQRVAVPFAHALANLVPPAAVRLRRDFGTLLNLIRAHALIHRDQRDRDDQGLILATLNDYRAIRLLVGDLLAEGIDATVSDTMRKTVAAVKKLARDASDGVSGTKLARMLGLDKSSASRRAKAAIGRGYLKNLEDKRGREMRLMIGDPLPDDVEVLPTPERLQEECCRVAGVKGEIDTPPPSSAKAELAAEEV